MPPPPVPSGKRGKEKNYTHVYRRERLKVSMQVCTCMYIYSGHALFLAASRPLLPSLRYFSKTSRQRKTCRQRDMRSLYEYEKSHIICRYVMQRGSVLQCVAVCCSASLHNISAYDMRLLICRVRLRCLSGGERGEYRENVRTYI